jgi:hypothetical protein
MLTDFSAYVPSLRKKKACKTAMFCVLPFLISEITDRFPRNFYESYAIGDHPNTVLLNFLRRVITTWCAREVVRWDRYLIFGCERRMPIDIKT